MKRKIGKTEVELVFLFIGRVDLQNVEWVCKTSLSGVILKIFFSASIIILFTSGELVFFVLFTVDLVL